MIEYIAIIILVAIAATYLFRQQIKKSWKGNKKAIIAGGVAVSTIAAATVALTPTAGFRPPLETLIRNSNGRYWAATGANIQVAIDDFNGCNGIVYLPEGTISYGGVYNVSNAVNITLQGAGKGVTILENVGAHRSILGQEGNLDSLIVRDMTLINNGGTNGIRTDSIPYVLIENVEVVGFGIGLFHGGTNPPNTFTATSNLTIKNCVISECTRSGIEFGHINTSVVRDNFLYDNNRGIYVLSDSDHIGYEILIDKNIIKNCTSNTNWSIYVTPINNCIISNNLIDGAGQSKGIGAQGYFNLSIINNIVKDVYDYGVFVNNVGCVDISGNTISDVSGAADGNGIALFQCQEGGIISNNKIINTLKNGIYIRKGDGSNSSWFSCNENVIIDAGSFSVSITACHNFTCNDNILRSWSMTGWTEAGIGLYDCDYATVNGNILANRDGTARQHGVYFDGCDNIICESNVISPVGITGGLIGDDSGNVIIKDNIGYDNSTYQYIPTIATPYTTPSDGATRFNTANQTLAVYWNSRWWYYNHL